MSIISDNKSVLGSAFDQFVQDQLSVRSKKISSTEELNINKGNILRDSDVLNYTLSKAAFVRLSSGVDLDKDLALRLFNNESYAGPGLAKSFILQSGTLNNKGGLRGGFSGENSAYTIGGISDFGLRPMPGIQSVSIKSKGRWGSLREADIKIKCFNRDQLSIIEVLYLRPGYTILLEWGHSVFFDNKGTLINNVQFMDLFQDGITRNDLYKEMLRKQKQYSGNYDAFMGPVANFTVKTNADGTYDCNISAFSWGYVIESLKINASSKLPAKNLNNFFGNSFPIDESINQIDKVAEKTNKSRINSLLSSYFTTCNQFNDGKNHKIFIKNIYQRDLDKDPTGHSTNTSGSIIDKNILSTFAAIPFTVASSNDLFDKKQSRTSTDLNVYIPLPTLLSVISKNCLVYNTPTGSKENNIKDPIVNINFNTSENYCFSSDYQISIDPKVCLIKYDGSDFPTFGLNKKDNKINPYLPNFKNTKYSGNTMSIMVNIDYIFRLLDQLSINDESREVHLFDFLKELMRGINIALGKINEFNVGLDDETNTVTIYDKQILSDVSPKEISIINTTGLKSVVREININTKISTDLASLIAIGAQASGVGIGTDASVLSQYNKGLTDRLMRDKKSNVNENDLSFNDFLNFLKDDDRTEILRRTIDNIYNKQIIISDDVEACKNIYADIMNVLKSKDPNTKASSIIPFIFNIKMDGISGIKYGQMFSIEPSRLPKSYLKPEDKSQPFVGFLVYSIEHEIRNNTWTTEIAGQAAPIRDARVKDK